VLHHLFLVTFSPPSADGSVRKFKTHAAFICIPLCSTTPHVWNLLVRRRAECALPLVLAKP
ncbi:MAG: hypothetical protein VX484_04355, partial [Chloroflexota bacterium]|nr:hypothetical protein [Chloroflexota bacterium]